MKYERENEKAQLATFANFQPASPVVAAAAAGTKYLPQVIQGQPKQAELLIGLSWIPNESRACPAGGG